MKRSLIVTVASVVAATNLYAAEFRLQEAINNASSGDTITIPEGTYTQSITIDKSITLDGKGAVLEVKANHPAIQVNTSRPVSLKNLVIHHKAITKPQSGDLPYAIYTSGGNLLIDDCTFQALGNSSESPCAVLATEKSTLHIQNSHFDGFNYTIQLGNKSKGRVEDCLIMNPGHCGITIGNGASAELRRNIVTGSRYHGIRCTGGEIIADSNLIIANKNRGFYIGNKSAVGTLSNNLIVDNATGINVFANSKLSIENNIILRSSYAGLALVDTAKLDIENNVIADNERGLIGFSAEKGEEPSINLRGKNLIHANTVQSEKIKLPSRTIETDPQFADAKVGLFAISAKNTKGLGLADPTSMQALWDKWKKAAN